MSEQEEQEEVVSDATVRKQMGPCENAALQPCVRDIAARLVRAAHGPTCLGRSPSSMSVRSTLSHCPAG